MDEEHDLVSSRRPRRLAAKLANETYRSRYVEAHNRRTLAQQVRELRGDLSQGAFARKLGTSQQIVSRLENPNYPGWTATTFFAVARKLGIAAIMRFVDFPTFLRDTNDLSEEAMCPKPYDQAAVDAFVTEHERFEESKEPAPAAMSAPPVVTAVPAEDDTPANVVSLDLIRDAGKAIRTAPRPPEFTWYVQAS